MRYLASSAEAAGWVGSRGARATRAVGALLGRFWEGNPVPYRVLSGCPMHGLTAAAQAGCLPSPPRAP